MDITNILMQTIGGLGLFILGMKIMTEGLEMAAGQKIKQVLEAISSNRVIGCITGAGVTAAIQSSSATTVMLIGFVSAGIMSFEQSVSVILGANIGTTITGQMIAFKLTKLALPAIAIGVPMKFFSKKRRYRHIGDIILGFGLLFYGMTVMKHGLAPIKSDPQFIAFFTKFNADTIAGILLCISVGTFATIMVQSSSATVGLTITLASQGLLSFPIAMALVLGENIGTTITAQIATIGTKSISAHQTARAHTLFNVIGVSIIVIFFQPFVNFVEYVTLLFGASPVNEIINGETVNIARYIANGHTLFNVVNVMIFLIFLPKLTQAAIFLSPKKKSSEEYKVPEFNTTFIDSTIGALAKVRGEVTKMAKFTQKNLIKIRKSLTIKDNDILARREEIENHIDAMQKSIIHYLTTIYQGGVNEAEAIEISEIMRITNNIERVGDSMESVSRLLEHISIYDIHLSHSAIKNLEKMLQEVNDFFEFVINELVSGKTNNFLLNAEKREDCIDKMREDMRNDHINRLRKGLCSVDTGVHFITLLSNFERMGDYCLNIATGINRIHQE